MVLLEEEVQVVRVEFQEDLEVAHQVGVEQEVDLLAVEEQVVKVEFQGEEQELIEVDQEEGAISGVNLMSHYYLI